MRNGRHRHGTLAYHDVHRKRGLYYLLQKRGAVERVCRDLEIFEAKSVPPQTTRARLRGEFIKRAQERRRDFTVDWVHLKLNDQAQRTCCARTRSGRWTSGSRS
jgi:proteasome accessory factor A